MSRYPRGARSARLKCIACNAPATETVDRSYVCVSCGRTIIANTGSSVTQASGD